MELLTIMEWKPNKVTEPYVANAVDALLNNKKKYWFTENQINWLPK